MTRSTRDLVEHHGALLKRCAAQREETARHAGEFRQRVAGVDRGIERLRRWAVHPAVIAATIALIVVLGRSRPLRAMGTVLGLMPPILRAAGSAAVANRRMRREKLDVW